MSNFILGPFPDLISQLQDKMWEWPGDEANANLIPHAFAMQKGWELETIKTSSVPGCCYSMDV